MVKKLSCLLLMLVMTGIAAAQEPPRAPDAFQFPDLINRKAFQRWWWAYEQRAYPLGEIPDKAHWRGLERSAMNSVPLSIEPAATNKWVSLGPAPIVGGQIGRTLVSRKMSGRVTAIAVDPVNPAHWLVGAAQGGVWESLDGGKTWKPKTDAQASLAMGAIAFAPSDPGVVFAGTGEASFSGDSYGGAGLLKSTDGGATWSLLAAQPFEKSAFSAIRVQPANASVLLAASAPASFGGVNGTFPSPTPRTGVYKSKDGGATWSQKLDGMATDLQTAPGAFSKQYAGIGAIFGDARNGVYRSTNEGETWLKVNGPWGSMPGGIGRVELAFAPSNRNVLYVSIMDTFDGVGRDGGLLGLWRTNNAWALNPSWVRVPANAIDDGSGGYGYCGWDVAYDSPVSTCWYNHVLSVHPTNPSTLFAGGVGLWKCTNCGASPVWTEVSKTASNPALGIHVDQHALAWSGSRLIVGNDGGVWSSTNGGSTWADHNTNLGITQFYSGSLHPVNPSFGLGGSQDNGTEKWIGTKGWPMLFYGDGADNAISRTNPDMDWAVSSQFLTIVRTKDGGGSFSLAKSGIDTSTAPFIGRFDSCPANADVLIAGTTNLWKTINFFGPVDPSWSVNSPTMTGTISAVAFAAHDTSCNTYAFGTELGGLRLTTNGGNTWVNIDTGNAVPNRYVTRVSFAASNPDILFVTLSGFDEGTPGRPGHVFKTTNALSASPAWQEVSPPVNLPHNALAVDPGNPSTVFVGTDIGVWKSTNGGSTWVHMGPATGMPNVAVFDLKINSATNRVVAYTHGRGAFTCSLH